MLLLGDLHSILLHFVQYSVCSLHLATESFDKFMCHSWCYIHVVIVENWELWTFHFQDVSPLVWMFLPIKIVVDGKIWWTEKTVRKMYQGGRWTDDADGEMEKTTVEATTIYFCSRPQFLSVRNIQTRGKTSKGRKDLISLSCVCIYVCSASSQHSADICVQFYSYCWRFICLCL